MARPNYIRVLAILTAMMTAALAMVLMAPGLASAQTGTTFTVNSTGDENDLDFPSGTFNGSSDGKCDVNSGTGGDQCTLRAAIQEANVTAGADIIDFDIPVNPSIPGDDLKIIEPSSRLPSITDQVTIDGYTQQGASPATSSSDAVIKIELNGQSGSTGSCMLIMFQTSGSVVKGLAVNRSLAGICLALGTGNRIEGNFIGTDASGTLDRGNTLGGVDINESSGNIIGGSTPDKRNVISGNNGSGVSIIQDPNVSGDASQNNIQGNYIGTQKDGITALPNETRGVSIGASNNTVGGTTPGAANIIAHNKEVGVMISAINTGNGFVPSTGNRILSNSIFSNDDLGIDLRGTFGPDPNDPKDADTGAANNLQNFPELFSATTSSITGRLNSRPRKTFTIQFFSNPSGTDEGKTLIGEKTVKTSRKGTRSFTFTPSTALTTGDAITATATNNATGDTSEFSAPVTVS